MARQKLARRVREEEEAQGSRPIIEALPKEAAPHAHASSQASARRSRTGKKTQKSREQAYWHAREVKIEPIFDAPMLDSPAHMNLAQVEASLRSAEMEAGVMHSESGLASESGNWMALEGHAQPGELARLAAEPSASEMVHIEALALERKLKSPAPEMRAAAPMQAERTFVLQASDFNVLQRVREWFVNMARRMRALLARLKGPGVTPSGLLALRQLQRLYAFISAGMAADDMEMVRLKVAFGEAYYHVTEASRRRRAHKRADTPEDYQAYIERFLQAENGDESAARA
ncbi:Uncharacterised protein [uncultured archaeon]|nr:Uncharacterised protein [uncultured archaeon]